MQKRYRNNFPPPTVQIMNDINQAQQVIQQGLPPVMPQQVTTTANVPADSQTGTTGRSHEQQVIRNVIPALPAPPQTMMTEDDESDGDDIQVVWRSRIPATQRLGKHPRADSSLSTGARRKVPRRDPYLADPDRQLADPMMQYSRGRSLERPGNVETSRQLTVVALGQREVEEKLRLLLLELTAVRYF